MGLFGHIAPVDGVIQRQTSTCLTTYIRVAIVGVPTFLSIMAWWIKCKFPFKYEEQCERVNEGVELHRRGEAATCPISGTSYTILKMTKEQEQESFWVDYFPGVGG